MFSKTLRAFAPALCALSIALSSACGEPAVDAASREEGPPPIAVEAVAAREGSLPLVERLSGVARAANQVSLRPQISGVVSDVLVRSGETVSLGQVLVRLRDDAEREQLQQALAAVDLAEASAREAEARVRELEAQVVRTRALAEQDLISTLELETREAQFVAAEASAAQARARVQQTRATVDERRATLARTVVRAPIDGRVGRRNVEVGMQVDPGTLLFELGSLDRLMVEVALTEGMLGYVREGQRVLLRSRALSDDAPLEAEISRISPFLAERTFSTVAEIDVDNRDGRLRPGMFVTVDVLYGESERATLLPVGALWEDPASGDWFVYTAPPDAVPGVEPGTLTESSIPFERRAITVRAEGRASVGVEGVAPGEWVVTIGQHLLAEREDPRARLRPTTWERVERMQSLQREDLLERFFEKQRRVARERGATPPPNREYVSGSATASPSAAR